MFKKFILILLVPIRFASAQTDSLIVSDSVKHHKLNLLSNLANARVFFDTNYIGLTPLMDLDVKEGAYHIKVVNPKSLQDWQNDNELLNLYISNDTTINVDFQYFYYFNTNPFNAKVFKNDTMLGMTPLRLFNNEELSGNLIFKKKDYRDFVFDLGTYDFAAGAIINLQPKGKETVNDIVFKNKSTEFNTKRKVLPILLLGAASIVGGYLAINYKNQSNDAYDLYLLDGSQAELDVSSQNDTYFVISLVLMQAAIGGLIYFLFFD